MSDTEESNTNIVDDAENGVIEIDGDAEDSDIGIEGPEVKIDFQELKLQGMEMFQQVVEWSQSPKFYAQLGIILAAVVLALIASKIIGKYLKSPSVPPQAGSMSKWREFLFRLKGVLFPLFLLLFLGVGVEVVAGLVQQSWLVRIAQSLAVVGFIYSVITQFIQSATVKKFVKWIAIPIAILHVFGWLDDVTGYLDSIKLQIGNISISLHAVARVLIFGSVLFWLGRISNDTGKQFIRKQENIEVGTREVFAKLFEIALFVVIFILLLQVMGINLTALAVFGGAVGVGLGFGLQAIASNFISGLIILLDRSLTVGDYIELEDGRSGTIRALNMRSTILKTFDGKDIMVPN